MKKMTFATLALSLMLPLGAQAQTAGNMTQEQLLQYATDRDLCKGGSVVSASYVSETDPRVAVTCSTTQVTSVSAQETSPGGLGGVSGAGIAAAVVGVGIVALAAGGSSSSSDTQ